MHRTRSFLAALGALVLTAGVAGPALAAKPTFEVIDIGTPEVEAADGAFLSALCGFEVTASADAWVIVHTFTDRNGDFAREIDNYQIVETFTNADSGAAVTLHDVGPDIATINRDGELILAQIGRSLTGSGYIGRVVVNLDTNEVLSAAGRNMGTLEELICEPLAP
jgi:hypothetical protein